MIAYPTTLAARQRPPAGTRLSRPISGGLWLPGAHGGVSDASGCNPPATVIGGVSYVQGPFGGPALKLDNSTGYIDCGLNGNTAFNWSTANPFQRTFWAWIRLPTANNIGPIFSKGNNSPNSGWQMSVNSSQGIDIGIVGSSNTRISCGTGVLADTNWHHVLVSWSGQKLITSAASADGYIAVYIDGVFMGMTTSGSGDQNNDDVFNLWIGRAQYIGGTAGAVSAYADLEIDHWGFDHRCYNADDVMDLYRRPFRNFAQSPIFKQFRPSTSAPTSGGRPFCFVCT